MSTKLSLTRGAPSDGKESLPEHLEGLYNKSSRNLDEQQKSQMKELLRPNNEVFLGTDGQLGRTGLVKHTINTGDQQPIRQHPRGTPLHLGDEVRKQVNDMMDQGVIEPSSSPWSSPIVLVPKKDGTYCFCLDYRCLNSVLIRDAHPIPRVGFWPTSWISTLDLMSGYWQVEVDPKDMLLHVNKGSSSSM